MARTIAGMALASSNPCAAEGTVLISDGSSGACIGKGQKSRTSSTVPPRASGPNSSKIDKSKQIEVENSVRCMSAPKASAAQPRKPTAFAWVIITPFGWPVEPEV